MKSFTTYIQQTFTEAKNIMYQALFEVQGCKDK